MVAIKPADLAVILLAMLFVLLVALLLRILNPPMAGSAFLGFDLRACVVSVGGVLA